MRPYNGRLSNDSGRIIADASDMITRTIEEVPLA
jgi:hypothetical protein